MLAPQFAKLPPLAKIGIWLGLTAIISSVLQGVMVLLRIEFDILAGSGRGLLLAIALAGLLAVMAADRRPISQFGLFVGPRWKKLWFGGLAVGVVTMIAYLAIALAAGALQFGNDVNWSRLPKSLLSAMTSMPLALVQQILFCGYLLSMLRERYHQVTSILVTAFLFAILGRINRPDMLLETRGQSLVIGLFLVGTLLGVLRLRTGNIIFPAGLLGGWMFVRRLGDKSGLIESVPAASLSSWLAPYGDVRQAPLLWFWLAAGIAGCWWALARQGETEVPESAPSMDKDFKRIFPFGHSNGLATLDVWLPLLAAARFRVGLAYVPKLVAVLVCSTINTILTLPERLLLPILLRKRELRDPIVIVGCQRSGTTHLHNLMAIDPQYCTPKNFHVMNPAGCVFSGWLIGPLLGAFMPWKRPMDAVRFGLFSPQEDEFGIMGLTSMSPGWGMTFPRLWPQQDRYMFPDKLSSRARARWAGQLVGFLKRATFWNRRKQLLLKNPYATGRVRMLHEIFPRAKFVHIYRNPYDVYRSNLHLVREGHVVNQLQNPDPDCSYETRFLGNYRAMEEAFYRDTSKLPLDQVAEVRFEDLESDPLRELRRIYRNLSMTLTVEFEDRLTSYLSGLTGYKKNTHRELPDNDRDRVNDTMGPLMAQWGYRAAPPARDAA
jgi:hypothetical protein